MKETSSSKNCFRE